MKPPPSWPKSPAWRKIPHLKKDPDLERFPCHPERSKCSAKRSTYAVEGPLVPQQRREPTPGVLSTIWVHVPSNSMRRRHPAPNHPRLRPNLTGTVKNSTTNKPAAGDDVVLLKLGQGMEEAGRTKADAQGHFSFKLDDAQSPHLVRAIHQDVTYHRTAPPGTTSVELEVFDVGKKIDGIQVVADILRVESAQGQLEIVREFGVQNTSNPPRTQMSEHNLEFYIPDGAHIIEDSGSATTENGNPLKTAPVPEGEKNRYSFIFPLRPGLTRFEVAYQLPYTGSANLDPKSVYPLEHFVVMLPKTMQFTAAAESTGYKSGSYPGEPKAIMEVASNTRLGENLAFKVTGEGALEEPQEAGAQGQGQGQSSEGAQTSPGAQATDRPGGGLGPPIDAPDPLQKYRWWILFGIAFTLIL